MEQNEISKRVTIVFGDADLQAINAAIKVLEDTLLPYLIDLGPVSRVALAKMGPRTVDFVGKTYSYTQANPQLIKAHVDMDDFAHDVAALDALRSLQQALEPMTHMVESSLMQTGSQAYGAALKCYDSLKVAAKGDLPKAVAIAADLKERFAGQGPKKRVAAPAPAPAPVSAPVSAPAPDIKGSVAPSMQLATSAMAD